MAVGEEAEAAEALIPRFKFEKLLNQGDTPHVTIETR